jgi:SAM-dependent methyltransferase
VLRPEFQLDLSEANEVHWRRFYQQQDLDEASSFARSVVDRIPADATVLEFGCGSGRDTVFFARSGRTAVGADLSREAVDRAEAAKGSANVDRARFEVLDVSSPECVARFVARHAHPTGTVAVYLRFFLHSVEESAEDVLLSALVDALPGGFHLYAEFRTTQDEHLPKAYSDHDRRYIDEQLFAAKLRDRYGFEIEHLEAGRGLSPYRGEDPHLARVIASAPPRDAARQISGRRVTRQQAG